MGSWQDSNINKFYVYPFVPSATNLGDMNTDLDNLEALYQSYLKIYTAKLMKLRTQNINPVFA